MTDKLDAAYWDRAQPELRGKPDDAQLIAFVENEESLRHHVLFRTSGSSGVPRWVALSKRALQWSAARVNEYLQCGADDRWGCALPTEHVGGFGVLARASVAGGTVSIFSGKWSAADFVKYSRFARITVTSLVPAQVYDLVRSGLESPPSLRVAVVGGGALSPELARRARALGWPVRASYGMTETASQIATETAGLSGEEGLPLIPPWEAKVDAEGRIWVRGGGLLSAYVVKQGDGWALQVPIREDGWFQTEDVGRITHFGRLVVEGRAARVVKILGELVSLDRLDRLWEEVCGDAAGGDAALSAVPDERRGFQIVLAVSGSWEAGRLERCRTAFDERVAAFERIQRIQRLNEIPRTALGKVRHEELGRQIVANQKSRAESKVLDESEPGD